MDTKRCGYCRQSLPLAAFHSNKSEPDGKSFYCRDCASGKKGHTRRIVERFPDGKRRCNKCQCIKPLDEFNKEPRGRFGRQAICRKCHSTAKPKPEIREGYQCCPNCGEEKPATLEFFRAASRRKSGLGTQCRLCARKYAANWREEKLEEDPNYISDQYYRHQDKNKARARRYYEVHKEQHRARDRIWIERNSDRYQKNQREYYAQHREKIIERLRRWRKDNSERYRAYNRRWVEANPEKAKIIALATQHRRRARKRNLPDTFTTQEWEFCLKYWRNCCAVCHDQEELHADHWIALARSDSLGTVKENMIVLCANCNEAKSTTYPDTWLSEKLGEDAAAHKLAEIHAYFEYVKTLSQE